MKTVTKTSALAVIAALGLTAGTASAQELPRYSNASATADENINVIGVLPTSLDGLADGPTYEGYISARNGNEIEVTTASGEEAVIAVGAITDIKARGGFLGLGRTELTTASLLNGLPVRVETVRWANGLLASEIRFSDDNFETAQMIQTGTNQRFTANENATEALRGRVANIDNYDITGVTNVYFDTGKWNISPVARAELCDLATAANAQNGAQILVLGYTDSVGDQEYNQVLSERRASGVVNYLQQECGWAPWRMMTPTGMAESDPAADNTTEAGRAQNRRVSVNILVSKALDEGMGG